MSLSKNLTEIRARIEGACERAGRDPAGVTLIAVTKVFPAAAILDAYALGCRDFGENYVQEFEGKFDEVKHLPDARFHLIGHLQSNKSRKAGELFQAIHTLDSAKLARRLDELGRGPIQVFVEVKLSGEESKAGADPAELPALVDAVRACPNLQLMGLMTMPPWSEDPETARPYFRRLRELAGQYGLTHLSMGMSNDFETAIEEGATHIRVGTALFGKRPRKV